MTDSPIEDQPLPGFEPEEEPVPEAIQQLKGILAENQDLLNELVRLRGQQFVPVLQSQLLDIRVNVLLEFLLEAIGEQHRLRFAFFYESAVRDYLEQLVSEARRAALTV